MVTFIHTGDVHLDTPFSAYFNKQQMQIRRREIMQTFRSIVLAAKDKDFLFIAGDLFDAQYVSRETIEFVRRCFSEIPDTRVFIAAGNHDPLLASSVYQTTEWGENVSVFNTEWEYFDFPEKKTRIHGKSFVASHVSQSLLRVPEIASDWCNLIVLHGELVSVGGESAYNPIDRNDLANSKADYIALGHIHQRSELQRVDGVYYAYCGIPDGRGFDEEGEKGYYMGEATKGMVSLTWVPSSRRRFWHVTCDISESETSFDIQKKILEAINKVGAPEDCYKVFLVGITHAGMIDIPLIEEEMQEHVFFLDIIDDTKLELRLEESKNDYSLRGDFTTAMMEKIQSLPEEKKEIGYLALELGLSAMERGQS